MMTQSRLAASLATDKRSGLRAVLALVPGYYAVQMALLVVRFGALPDFVRVNPWLENVIADLLGYPSLDMAVPVILREPWIEAGRTIPGLPLAEWSLHLQPLPLALVAIAAFLAGAGWRSDGRPDSADAARLAGLAGVAISCTSLTWIACCATPSWTVLPALLGLWVSTALSLTPLGPFLAGGGFLLLLAGWAATLGPRENTHAPATG